MNMRKMFVKAVSTVPIVKQSVSIAIYSEYFYMLETKDPKLIEIIPSQKLILLLIFVWSVWCLMLI